jgi:serine/threonine protein kinase
MMKRQVALKVMHPNLSNKKGFKERFLYEGEIIAQLEHPNIIRIYDINIINDIYYMSMEYLSGGTLKEQLQLPEKKYSLASCIVLLKQVGAGLSFAHKHGYIHRDIKPSNILFSNDGTAILTDFGIAKLQDTCSDLTKMGYSLGTVQYMSPEQATEDTLDQRSDVYNLGLIFYEMLIGKKAVRAKTERQVLYKHTNAPPPIFPAKYHYLQNVLNKVLAKRPDDRFNSVQEFIDALIMASDAGNDETRQQQKQQQQNVKENIHSPVAFWIKMAVTVAILSVGLLVGMFFYFDKKNKDRDKHVVENTFTLVDKTSTSHHKKINYIYEPHVYYNKLEAKIDLLAKETMELLALVPDNKEAQQAQKDIVNRYHSLALTQLRAMNIAKVSTIIDKGLELYSNDKRLKNIKKIIHRKHEEISKKEAKRIQYLNSKAKIQAQSGHYVTPKGDNALEIYQDILTIDPYNQKAIDEINAILAVFEKNIKNNIIKDSYRANELLNQAIAIAPFNKKLIQLQNKIKTIKNNQ